MRQRASNPKPSKNNQSYSGQATIATVLNAKRLQASLVVDNVAQCFGVENPNMALFDL